MEPLCRMIGAGRGPSDRANFIQRGESERAVWCLPGGADLPWCAAAGAQLPGHWSRFGPLCRIDRRRERPVGPGESERAVWCLPGGADLPWCAAAGAQLPGHWSRFGPLCRMIAAGRGPSDRASFIQRGESERAVWCLPGGADLPWCAAAGAQLPGHWSRFGPLCRMIAAGRGPSDRANFIQWCGASRAVRICHGAPQRGRNCPATGFDLDASLPHHSGGESERAVWCLPGGADLPWCAAAGAQLPGHWTSLPHDRRRERPVGPGQFHSERRIRAGRVVPPGRCGFAMVRRSGGATARPLEGPSDRAMWCLPGGADLPWCAAAGAQLPGHWIRFGASLPHDRRRERPVGPGQFHSERRIRAGRVVPPGRCGFAMVRRSGGATARPLESIWASLPHGRAGRGPSDRASFIQRGESERAVWCLPGGADLPWCAAAGAQLPGHWSRFGASLPHGRRRERPVGPGQFHSERRIRAGRVVPPGRCGFAMVRRSGGATARPLESIWASLPHDRRRERPVGPGHVVPPGRCGFAMVRRSGGATARPLDSIWSLSAAWSPPGEARRTGPPGHVVPPGRCGFAMVRRSGGATARPLDSIWASLPHDRRRERPVGPGQWCLPGRCGFAMVRRSGGATARPLESIWASLPHGRRRERPVGPGQFHSERRIRAGRVVPPGRCGFAMVRRSGGATARPLGPLCRMIAAGRGPSDRAVWCLPGGADLPWCAAAGAQLPGHWSRFGPLCRMIAAGRGPSDRASFIQRGESERAVWCLPGGADLPWCAAAGAQLPGHWIRFGASLPHGRRRERPVGPGQFHSERRIRAGRVVPPGRCGFAMVRRSGGATARPLESIWASLPHDRRRERPSDRAMWCLPGGADLPWCAAAGAQLPGHWIDLGLSAA